MYGARLSAEPYVILKLFAFSSELKPAQLGDETLEDLRP